MKLFKKLMAVTLAGVMALTVLTGCGSAVNKKELVAVMNDTKALSQYGIETIEQTSDTDAKKVLSIVKEYAEGHQTVYQTLGQIAEEALWDVNGNDPAKVKSIVPKDSENAYYMGYTVVHDFKSEEFKNNRDYLNAMMLTMTQLNPDVDSDKLGDKATVSIASQKIGDYTILVAVFVQAKK